MTHAPTMLKLTLFLFLLTTGCAHHQLRYQMANQAKTVHQTVEKQTLDNLAMFSVKPAAIPYFTLPNQGATNVDGDAKIIGGAPLNPFFTEIGLSGSRSSGNSWTMVPVTSAFNLERMRDVFMEYTASCDWLCKSNKRHDIPKCCTTYGEYCGCFVWVKPGFEDHFAKLVFRVLRAASKEEVIRVKNTKDVTIYINGNGTETNQANSVGKVQATIDIDLDPIYLLTQGASTRQVRDDRVPVVAAEAAYSDPSSNALRNTIVVPASMYPRYQFNDLDFLQRQRTLGGSQFRKE